MLVLPSKARAAVKENADTERQEGRMFFFFSTPQACRHANVHRFMGN